MKRRQIVSICLSGMLSAAAVTGCGMKNAKSEKTGSPEVEYVEPATEAGAIVCESIASAEGRGQMIYDGMGMSEEYNAIKENGFLSAAENPLSTFSVDVDTASYSNIRRMINRKQDISQDAVRIEEMINYFTYNYRKPEGNQPFDVTIELSDCPWNEDSQLLLIGLQAKEIDFDSRPMNNFVFLLDVSGSMYDADKLPLVQKSFALLTEELTENDRISIVTYAGNDSVVLEGVRGDEKVKIRQSLEELEAGGSTAGEAGINKAYEIAEKYFIPNGNNRVVLATDGDLNVGISSEGELKSLIEEKKKSGVHLSVLGFGMGNIKDNKMEALADNGDGNYAYIDSLMEAKKVLVEEMGGTFLTVAKDVKIQVEFNSENVAGYRLIGYENRALGDEDFANDAVDAGEIGSGHRVTALYEIIRDKEKMPVPVMKYQNQEKDSRKDEGETQEFADELLTVNIRYKEPDGGESKLLSYPALKEIYQEEMSPNMKWASGVAEFGMLLRDSPYKGSSSWEEVLKLGSSVPENFMDDYKDEFLVIVRKVSDR